MLNLLLAITFFVGIHLLIAGTPMRSWLIIRMGALRYRGSFSALSLLGLFWIMQAYRAAPYVETWGQWVGFKPFALPLMWLVCVFIVAGTTSPNPTALTGEKFTIEDVPTAGILRVTRHPFLWGVALWALVHALANGHLAALLLFGGLLLLCLLGTCSIDRRRRQTLGPRWDTFASRTSNIPFHRWITGIEQLTLVSLFEEVGWPRLLGATVLWLLVLDLHLRLFGVSPLW